MAKIDGLPVNFTISDAAKAGIEAIKTQWNAQFPDKAVVPTIAWGYVQNESKVYDGMVIVSFYTENQYNEIKHGIERISGIDLFFYITKENHYRFEGKMLDFTERDFFFLK